MQLSFEIPDDILHAAILQALAEREPPQVPSKESALVNMNKAQAAKYCGVSRGTLDTWIDQGLPTAHLGSRYILKKTDLDQWIDEHK